MIPLKSRFKRLFDKQVELMVLTNINNVKYRFDDSYEKNVESMMIAELNKSDEIADSILLDIARKYVTHEKLDWLIKYLYDLGLITIWNDEGNSLIAKNIILCLVKNIFKYQDLNWLIERIREYRVQGVL